MKPFDDRARARRVPAWFSLERARRAQRLLASMVVERDMLPSKISVVAGADLAYKGDLAIGVVVSLSFPELHVIEYAVSKVKVRFPYVPTLLAFREAGPIIEAVNMLSRRPDVLMVDGQGRAHPFRLGLASHVGVALKLPTIGVAKKRLCGREGERRGCWAPLYDGDEVIGAVVYTKPGARPIYVSVGNMISLETAIKLVLACCRGHRLPEPIRAAHNLATRLRREVSACSGGSC